MDLSVDSLLDIKTAAVAVWFLLIFAAERLLPAAREPLPAPGAAPLGWRRLVRNGGLLAGNALLSPLLVVPVSVWAAGVDMGFRPDWWSGLPGLALDILLLDLFLYGWHRLVHADPRLWRFHEVHHLDGFLDASSGLRFHFGEVALSALARAAVILAFSIPLASVLLFEGLVLLATIFHHSNLQLPPRLERALGVAIVTPAIHWVHHRAVRADTDSNYGTLFSVWDRLFRSRSRTRRTPGMAIGVEGRIEPDLMELLLAPLRPRRPPICSGRPRSAR